ADQIDVWQFQRSARSEAANDGARARETRPTHHPNISRLLSVLQRARVYLEQDPPIQSKPAARLEYRRGRNEDRLHQGSWLRTCRFRSAEWRAPDCRCQWLEIGERTRRRGQEAAGMGISQFSVRAPVC